MRPLFILALPLFLMTGCLATANKLNLISLGMNKSDVIKVMGAPNSTSANGDVEYLTYFLTPTDRSARAGIELPYFVKIVRGDVDSFGRIGDFGTTLPDRQDVTIRNVNASEGH